MPAIFLLSDIGMSLIRYEEKLNETVHFSAFGATRGRIIQKLWSEFDP